ncbi:MAG: hypothetical protein R3F16_11820 [Myxococcota bacterium]
MVLPVAVVPLWQVKHPLTTPVWSKVAGVKPPGVWQFSQVLLVGMWFESLPRALVPSWQEKQLSTMPV